ncbi:MAG TPA: BamA/TamA family outer membrane protein [Polyangiaceae bacterium]|nr:BamA/TamA family outer membrane protein [Polyangiaceae bacterium]
MRLARIAFVAFVSAWVLLGSVETAVAADKHDDPEFTIVPIVGGDSDVGVGGGYLTSLAHVMPGVKPYVWRLESAGAIAFKFGGGAHLGYLDDYVLLVVPHAWLEGLHVEARGGYTYEPTLYYYGLGNASKIDRGRSDSDLYYQYKLSHSIIAANATLHLGHALLLWGLAEQHVQATYPAGGSVARDERSPDARTRAFMRTDQGLDVAKFSYGVGWDSRDSEVSSHRGQYHTLRVDLAPGGFGRFHYAWIRVNLALRGFVTLVPNRLTFAARGVVDVLEGSPPFYELARSIQNFSDDTFAVGGGKGLRGVPAGRYFGSVKAFTNLELRSELFAFRAFQKRNLFGLTAFVDTGRVFSGLPSSAELDGKTLGMKLGVGLGARVTAGESFVVRGDVAWSPDAHPVGAYLLGGQLF